MSQDNGFPFYQGGRRADRTQGLVSLPTSPFLMTCRPESYLPDLGLVDAVNVALMLGQPLLVTGEPGTGKTQLANSISWDLGLGTCLKFETKSSSMSRDLFYIYNSLGRFHAAQTGTGSQDNRDYITYNALGEAVLRTHAPADVTRFAHPVHEKPQRSVVLIDEIDKAPRDFPNDILNEIEEMYFRVPELDNLEIRADPVFRPIVVITSNSEKHLPDAFLRRCIYYHVPFPDRQRLEEIVLSQLADVMPLESSFLADALDVFMSLRSSTTSLHKKPATAECLGWIVAMDKFRTMDGLQRGQFDELAIKTLGSLTKTSEDREAAYKVIEAWRDETRARSEV